MFRWLYYTVCVPRFLWFSLEHTIVPPKVYRLLDPPPPTKPHVYVYRPVRGDIQENSKHTRATRARRFTLHSLQCSKVLQSVRNRYRVPGQPSLDALLDADAFAVHQVSVYNTLVELVHR